MSTPTLSQALGAMLRRDLRLAFRNRGELANPLLFYIIVITLFPFGVGSEPSRLGEIAPGIIWVAALLATLLAMDRIFRSDFEDGSLEQLVLSPHPLSVLVLGKVCVHWILTGLPLMLITPLLGVLMHLPSELLDTLLLSLLLGTPTLSLIGAIGVALTVGVRRGGMLLTLLVLPLYVPVLIFGANVVQAAAADLSTSGQFYVLGALLTLSLTLSPLATAAALRISLN